MFARRTGTCILFQMVMLLIHISLYSEEKYLCLSLKAKNNKMAIIIFTRTLPSQMI